MRTYYCGQNGIGPTYPAGEIIVSERKVSWLLAMLRIRAATRQEAREAYEDRWNESCQQALRRERRGR
jgi:hypothetical protein